MLCFGGALGRPTLQNTLGSLFCQMKKFIICILLLCRACTPFYSEAQTSTVLKQQSDGNMQVVIPQGVSMETILALRDMNKDMLNTSEKVMETQANVIRAQEWISSLYWWLIFSTPLVLIMIFAYLRAKQRTEMMKAQIQYQIFTASQRSLPGYESPQVSVPMAVDHRARYDATHR